MRSYTALPDIHMHQRAWERSHADVRACTCSIVFGERTADAGRPCPVHTPASATSAPAGDYYTRAFK
jgi:hypothetical protein